MLKRHFAFLALAIAVASVAACSDAPESGRAIVSVSEINGGLPITSSVSSAVDDNVQVEFRFRPYNTLNTISGAAPHGDVIIERYVITWSGQLPSREEFTSFFLSVYEPNPFNWIRMVTAAEKGAVSGVPVSLRAHIDFFAREMGTDHKIEFSTEVTVSFTS